MNAKAKIKKTIVYAMGLRPRVSTNRINMSVAGFAKKVKDLLRALSISCSVFILTA
jgi:hypothetical protein